MRSKAECTYLWSTLAVASSITSILLFCRIARARHTNCRWPTLKLDPDSVNRASKPPFKLHIVSFNWTCVYKSEYTDNSSFIIKSFSIYHTHSSFNIARNSLFWTTLAACWLVSLSNQKYFAHVLRLHLSASWVIDTHLWSSEFYIS